MEVSLRFPQSLQTQLGLFGTLGLALNLPFPQIPSIHSLLRPVLQGPCGQGSPSWAGYGAPFSIEDPLWPLAPKLEKLYLGVFLFPTLVKWVSASERWPLVTDHLRIQYKSRTVSPLNRAHHL